MMKILVTGSNGLLGSSLVELGAARYSMIGIGQQKELLEGLPKVSYSAYDIADPSVTSVIIRLKPDVIIHTAGYTDVDGCERDHEKAYNVNVLGTKHIRDAANFLGIRCVFLSTDYIFDGEHGPYRETDTPHPQGFYGKTKLEGENIIQELGLNALICRTTVLYGYRPGVRNNFVLWVKNSLENGKEVCAADDQIGTPTFSDNLSAMIFDLIDTRASGVYNTVGSELIDRYSFALKIATVFSLSKTFIRKVQTKDLNQTSPRPRFGGLRIDKLCQAIQTKALSVEDGLNAMKQKMNSFLKERD